MLIKAWELLESACGSGETESRYTVRHHVLSMMPGPSGDACIKGLVLHQDAWLKRGTAPHDGSAELGRPQWKLAEKSLLAETIFS
jgi:hypothetical protein